MKHILAILLILFVLGTCTFQGAMSLKIHIDQEQKERLEQENREGWSPPDIPDCGLPTWDEIRGACNE